MAAPVPTSILILSSTYYFPLSKGKWIEGRELCMLIGICFWEVEVRLETQAKITKRRWGLPLWYDSSGLGGSGTFLYLSFALKVGLCFFRAEFVPKTFSHPFVVPARLFAKVVISWSATQTSVESVSILTDVVVHRVLRVHSTVPTLHQRSLPVYFSLNSLFSLWYIIKMHLTWWDFITGILSNTKWGHKFLNSVALIGQSLKSCDRILQQSLNFSFLRKRSCESGKIR